MCLLHVVSLRPILVCPCTSWDKAIAQLADFRWGACFSKSCPVEVNYFVGAVELEEIVLFRSKLKL